MVAGGVRWLPRHEGWLVLPTPVLRMVDKEEEETLHSPGSLSLEERPGSPEASFLLRQVGAEPG